MKKNFLFTILLLISITLIVFLFNNINTNKNKVKFQNTNLTSLEKLSKKRVVLVYYGSSSCEACNTYYPNLYKYAKKNKIFIYYVNATSKNDNFAKKYNLESTPVTLIIYRKKQYQYIGSQNACEIKQIFNKYKSLEKIYND